MTLNELKEEFYNEPMSSFSMLMKFEQVSLGTQHVKDNLAYIFKSLEKPTMDEVYHNLYIMYGTKTLFEVYPELADKFELVDYTEEGVEPQEWDIAQRVSTVEGVYVPPLYVYLDGEFKVRCEPHQGIQKMSAKDKATHTKAYRLK